METGPEERLLVQVTNLGGYPKKYKGESREIETRRGEKPKNVCFWLAYHGGQVGLSPSWRNIFKKPTFAFVHDHDEVVSL